jgi:hypothetical protein
MDKATSSRTWLCGFGFAMLLLGGILPVKSVVYYLLLIIGSVSLVFYFFTYMQGKGYNKWLGLLVLLGPLGIIIMVLLPHNKKRV